MRTLGLCAVGALLLATAPVDAATCAKVCTTNDLWGYGPGPTFTPCQCPGDTPGARVGPSSCGCGECYQTVGSKVIGYAKSNGVCQTGSVDCGDCDVESESGSGSKNVTTTTAPPSTNGATSNAASPSLTPSSSSGTSSSATDSGTTTAPSSNNTNTTDDSKSSSSSSSGLATWQIALIICSCVLVIAVVMMTITSCYCKARNRMNDNIKDEQERQEYEEYWNSNGGEDRHNDQLAQSTFGPAMTQAGRSSFNSAHSRPNSNKSVPYAEPTYIEDRIGGRATPRKSLGSTADLPGVYQPFPQRGPPDSVNRKNIAIEL